MDNVELLVLRNLLYNEDYARKVVPFIKPDYFEHNHQKIVFEEINEFLIKYDQLPTKEAVKIEIDNRTDTTQEIHKQVLDLIEVLEDAPTDQDWLLDTSEKWCRDRAIYLALMESIQLADGKDEKRGRDAIPTILSDALACPLTTTLVTITLQDYEERYESYHKKEDRIPFDLEYFNKITKGGIPNKTLNIALAGTGVGKSLFMCHMASACLLNGSNVLYITMEMAEEKIAERIDANLLNVNIQEITDLPKPMFETKVTNLCKKTQGQLIIKEYPTASAHSGHFRALLNELALKKSFRPDIIFIDYLNICASSRYRGGGTINSYTLVKSIAEELRGLVLKQTSLSYLPRRPLVLVMVAVMLKVTDTSESFGLPATADLMFALISTEELEELGQIMVKQLKNRYNDLSVNKRFIVGIDRAKMRLYDCEQSAQHDVLDSGNDEEYTYDEKPKKSFEGFKF